MSEKINKVKIKSINIALSFLLLVTSVATTSGSWEQIDIRLRSLGKVPLSYRDLESLHELSNIFTQTNASVFVEMTAQTQFPLVATAGFLWLSAKGITNEAYSAALRIVISAAEPGKESYLPAFEYLTNRVKSSTFDSIFGNAVQVVPHNSKIRSIAISQMPYESLYAWFHNRERQSCIPSWEAIVLDRLFRDCAEHKSEVSEQMRNALRQYREIPGYPLLVYLLYSPVDSLYYQETLNLALMDNGLEKDMLLILISNRRESIRSSVDLPNLKLSEARRIIVEKALTLRPRPAKLNK